MSLPAVRFRIPLGAGFSVKISCFSPLNSGTLFWCCVLGQDTLPSHASLDSGVNEYLVGQRWQCVRLVPSAEMAASAVCSKTGVEMVHEWTGPGTRGDMCEAHRALYVRYIRNHHYYYYHYKYQFKMIKKWWKMNSQLTLHWKIIIIIHIEIKWANIIQFTKVMHSIGAKWSQGVSECFEGWPMAT